MMLQKETLRETVPADDGRTAVIINLTYPAAKGKKNKVFCAFYRQAAEAFCTFARTDLKARAAANPPGTPPCGAVLSFEAAEEKNAVIVTLSGSVFDGFETHPIPKDVRKWDKEMRFLQIGTNPQGGFKP